MTGSHPSGLPQPDEIVGQYRIVGEIGRGGMAAVLEALRLHDGARCALKVMLPATRSEDVAERFRREFRALSHLSHPNVLKVYEGGVYDGRPFFAMELLDGRELRDEVEQWRGLPPGRRFERARDILIQLARALEYIHNRGWVHRDVTPANIMILPDGQVKLMDFGVVKEPGADLTVAGEVVGTVAYIAPEQIRGQRVDARADLYSLGAVLYLMLTGRRPFNARTLSGYLDKHLNRTVRPPHALAPTVSRELDAICVRLLEKDPAARFASATHLLYMLGAERPALQAAAVTTIAGRAWERSVLREAVALLDAGRGGLIMLEGASGMGCSRLVSEGVRLSRQLGIAISWGQNRSPNQPAFSGLREIYTNLLAEGRDSPAALTLTYDGGEERAELYAICAAFKELMASEAPRLVCIEDIDRADPGTLQVVEYLIRNLAELPVLFLLSRRPPEDPAHDPLSGLISGESTEVQARHLILEPLPVSAVEEMVLYRVQPGERATALSERLHQESEGNPFIVLQMLNGLEAAGVIHNRTVQMTAALLAHAPLPIPRSLKEALERKLSALSTSGLVVARLVALSRVEVDDELLALAAPALPDAERDATIDALLDAEVLKERRVGATERFELIHLRLQDVIIEDIPEDVSRALHRQLGVALEQRSRHNVEPIVELLAHHFDQGDVPSKAYSYLVWAAEKLQGQAFTMSALRMLQRAVALEPRARPYMPLVEADKRKTRVLLSQSNVLYHLGRWEEALEVAQQADTYARGLDDDALLARTATELASQARALGQYAEAEAELDRALKHAALANEGRLQIVPLYERGAMRWGAGDLSAARALFEEALQLSERYQDGRGLALGSNGLGVLAMCEGQSAAARRYFERAIEVCEQHDLMERLAIARTNLAELSHCMGNIRKGLSLADRTITDAREVDHRSGVGIGLRYRALLLGDLGRWAEAEENAREAIRIQQKLGSQDEELASSVALARVVLGRGDDNRAPALLDNSLKLAEQHDTEGYLPVIRAWRSQLMAAAGDKDAAIEELNAAAGAGHNWPHQKLRQLLNAARAWKMVDAPETAIELAESALRLAETCGYRYYAMRARQLLADTLEKEASVSRHQRVAEALARSLAANLPAEDGAAFLLQQGLQPQTLHRRRLRTRTNSTS